MDQGRCWWWMAQAQPSRQLAAGRVGRSSSMRSPATAGRRRWRACPGTRLLSWAAAALRGAGLPSAASMPCKLCRCPPPPAARPRIVELHRLLGQAGRSCSSSTVSCGTVAWAGLRMSPSLLSAHVRCSKHLFCPGHRNRGLRNCRRREPFHSGPCQQAAAAGRLQAPGPSALSGAHAAACGARRWPRTSRSWTMSRCTTTRSSPTRQSRPRTTSQGGTKGAPCLPHSGR